MNVVKSQIGVKIMTSIKFIDKLIKETERSYTSFDLEYRLFGRECDKRDADALMKKLIQL